MSKYNAQMKYDKEHTTVFTLKLNNKTDKDIIDILNKLDNKQGFIKKLIRNSEKSIDNR